MSSRIEVNLEDRGMYDDVLVLRPSTAVVFMQTCQRSAFECLVRILGGSSFLMKSIHIHSYVSFSRKSILLFNIIPMPIKIIYVKDNLDLSKSMLDEFRGEITQISSDD